MPVHDWSTAEPWLFHQLHFGWVMHLAGLLNNGGLPDSHFALTEYGHRLRSRGESVDVLRASPGGEHYFKKRRTIAVRRTDYGYAALIEIVSPAVKSSPQRFRRFVHKLEQAIAHGIHVLVVDPLPPCRQDPHGIHAAVWSAIRGRPDDFVTDKPLTLASYAADPKGCRAYVEPYAVGDAIPDMPLFLEPDRYVLVPLEAAYQAAWDSFPKPLRPMVEGDGRRTGDSV